MPGNNLTPLDEPVKDRNGAVWKCFWQKCMSRTRCEASGSCFEWDRRTALEAALTDHVVGWRTMDSAPKDGGYLVSNRKREVAFCDVRDGYRIVHNVPGHVEWDYSLPPTHWQPLPARPVSEGK